MITCIIHEGTYREQVVQKDNVTFRRFEQDEVVVSGTDPVTGCSLYSGEIYRAPFSWSGHEFTQVFFSQSIRGEMLPA
ncbi:hypothetical protein EGM51_00265 [Verrucomicrobia bacterium S94]|nr:hypothetical protein EGM51_00265 [Verrucomicrobia bacterium S94]